MALTSLRRPTVLSRLKWLASCQNQPSILRLERKYTNGMSEESSQKNGFRYENMYDRLLQVYSTPDGTVSVKRFLEDLKLTGLRLDDPRLQTTFTKLEAATTDIEKPGQKGEGGLTAHKFKETLSANVPLIEKALRGKFVIPEFLTFRDQIDTLYEECKPHTGGEVATYIPELARMDPNLWGVSLCTVDGQRHSVGDSDASFTLQSGSKCFTYALAVEEVGAEEVHKYIGKEPSGASFNSLFLNSEGKPHNPMINAGALVMSSMLKPSLPITQRVNFMLEKFCEMAGVPERSMKCDIMTCDSEMDTAHRNYALIHYMKDMKVFPEGVDIEDTLKFYTRICSVEVDCQRGAVMAATLANGGYCPITGNKVVNMDAVRNALTLMHSCGMYDSAGEFSFGVGLPAKSGVSGVILLVVPNVMGLCLFSPPVNRNGNSIRGLHFCQRLVETFNFHNYDNLILPSGDKADPRRRKSEHKELEITSIMYAAHAGALSSMESYFVSGIDLGQCNYDGRTPLHVAVAEGHQDIVELLLYKAGVDVNHMDRWSRTPLDEAIHFGNESLVNILLSCGAVTGSSQRSLHQNSDKNQNLLFSVE